MTKHSMLIKDAWIHCRVNESEIRAIEAISTVYQLNYSETVRKICRDYFTKVGLPPMGVISAYSDKELVDLLSSGANYVS